MHKTLTGTIKQHTFQSMGSRFFCILSGLEACWNQPFKSSLLGPPNPFSRTLFGLMVWRGSWLLLAYKSWWLYCVNTINNHYDLSVSAIINHQYYWHMNNHSYIDITILCLIVMINHYESSFLNISTIGIWLMGLDSSHGTMMSKDC